MFYCVVLKQKTCLFKKTFALKQAHISIDTVSNLCSVDEQSTDAVRPWNAADDGDQTKVARHGGYHHSVISAANPT